MVALISVLNLCCRFRKVLKLHSELDYKPITVHNFESVFFLSDNEGNTVDEPSHGASNEPEDPPNVGGNEPQQGRVLLLLKFVF